MDTRLFSKLVRAAKIQGQPLVKRAGLGSLRKQFRRALAAMNSDSYLLHATDNGGRAGLEGVLGTAKSPSGIRASVKQPPPAPDTNAAHGEGVYWLRSRPDGTYFNKASSEGIMTPVKGVYLRDNANALNRAGQPLAKHHALSSAYSLRGKDTAVVDVEGRQRDALIRLAGGTNPAKEHDRFSSFAQSLLPQRNADGLNEAQWLAERTRMHRVDPEIRAIKASSSYKTPAARDAALEDRIEQLIDTRPQGGIRRIDSQLLQMANNSATKHPGLLRPAAYEDKKIRELYLQQLKQRRKLRAAGALPQLKNSKRQ